MAESAGDRKWIDEADDGGDGGVHAGTEASGVRTGTERVGASAGTGVLMGFL